MEASHPTRRLNLIWGAEGWGERGWRGGWYGRGEEEEDDGEAGGEGEEGEDGEVEEKVCRCTNWTINCRLHRLPALTN